MKGVWSGESRNCERSRSGKSLLTLLPNPVTVSSSRSRLGKTGETNWPARVSLSSSSVYLEWKKQRARLNLTK